MTANLLDWADELQTSPDEEYQALLNGLRRAQGFGLYFVQCSLFSGGKLIERVQANLTEKTIGVLKFEHAIADGNVFRRISEFLSRHPVEVLFIQGLENSLFDAEETKKRLAWSHEKASAYTWREVPPVLINLNQQRERFRDSFATCFVFLLPQYAINYIVHRAPDFFDWRSGKVNYASDAETLAQESARIIDDADYDAYCSWSEEECKSRLFEIQALADETLTTKNGRARLYFEQGLLFVAAQDFSAAGICFDKAAASSPDFHVAFYAKGNALSNLGQLEEAIVCYDAALAIKPDDYEVFRLKGVALSALNRRLEAIACYDAALAIKPDDHEVLRFKGLSLHALDCEEEAIVCYDAALTIKPNDHKVLVLKGLSLHALDCEEEAIACYDAALAIKPDDHGAFYLKGLSLSVLGCKEEAIACYDNALAIKPDDYEALHLKGLSLYDLGCKEEAIACYDAALAIKPDDHEALHLKGLTLYDLGDQAGAITCYDNSLTIKPDYHQALNNKGNALYDLGDQAGAIACYDAALAIKPDKHEALFNKAFCCAQLGDVDGAVDALQQAITLDPQNRQWARQTWEFNPIRHDERFRALVEGGEE